MAQRIVIAPDWHKGSFRLSAKARKLLKQYGCPHFVKYDPPYSYRGKDGYYTHEQGKDRDCPALVRLVEELNGKIGPYRAKCAKIVEVPNNVKWHIEEDGDGEGEFGNEWVAEDHRTWR